MLPFLVYDHRAVVEDARLERTITALLPLGALGRARN